MPDSVGAGGFPRNINIGHEHLDLSSGFTYQYQGDVPTNVLNWKIINGVINTDPSVVGWGAKQLGAMWFNNSDKVYKYWDGVQVRTLAFVPTIAQTLYDYRSVIAVQDDLMSGIASNGTCGALGFTTFNGNTIQNTSVFPNIGLYNRSTGAAPGTVTAFVLQGNTNSLIPPTVVSWDMLWILRLNNIDANVMARIGCMNSFTAAAPDDGVYFEKLDADTNWFCVTRAATVQTRVDSGVACSTTPFVKFRIINTPTLSIFMMNDSVVASMSTNRPVVFTDPSTQIVTSNGVSKSMDIDYFELVVTGLTR